MSLLQTILQINSVARNETVRHGKPKINMGWYRTERESAVVTRGILNRSAIAGLVPPAEWQAV